MMEDDDDDDSDSHVCLKCQKLFTSLESYVQHRKEKCVRVKSSSSSIPSYRVVSESELRPDDFFHSLQLQSCNTNSTKSVEKNNIILKIEEVVLGNKEINEDDGDDDEDEQPPSGHTGGKWKPGYRPSNSQSSSSDERFSNDDHDYVIKTVHHKRLKVVIGPKSRKEAFVRKLAKGPPLFCDLCKVVFKSREQLVKHLTTYKHWRKRDKDEGEHGKMILNNSHLLAPISPFKCGVCPFYFNSHDYLVEHWNSKVEAHLKGENENHGFRCSACTVTMKTTEAVKDHLLKNRVHLENIREWHNKRRAVVISTADVIHCPYCDWSGKRQQALNFHIKWKHPSEEDGEKEEPKNGEIYRCSNCSFVAKRQASVLSHERRVHRPTETKSDEIGETVNDDIDAGEIDDNTDADWTRSEDSKGGNEKPKKRCAKNQACVHCGDLFGNNVLLQDHINSVHPDKLFRCEICSVTYELEALFVKHQNSRLHKYHTDGLAENTGDSTGEDHMCDQCEFKSFSKSGLLYHQVMHQGTVGCYCEKEQLDENQERVKREKKYRCPVCSEIVKINLLRTHLVSHTGERPYPCQWCRESFMAKVTLASHIRTKHLEKKFVCPFCPYRTQRKAKLASHLDVHQQKEARIRKCLCDICGAGFFNRSSLKHHMRLHLPLELGGKTQLCSFPGCRLSFRSPSELVYHTRTHTGERPYLCGNCGYSAKTKHQLTKHERSHNGQRPFKCRHCTYAAALSSQLLRHMRIHTGAKPYSCPYCDYTCNTHENLRKHVLKSKKHVGLSVYKCPHCDFGCNLASELKSHIFNLHSAITEQTDPKDSAFSSVVSGIFSRNEDRRDIDHPSTPYIPRTEKPGYREKMRQTWKPKSTADADENEDLTIVEGEEGAEDETDDIQDNSKHLARFLTENEQRVIVSHGGDDDHFRGIQENFTVVVEDGDDELEATSALKRLLENNAIVVPLDSADPNISSSIPLAVLNNVEMNSAMMEATDENGATVYLCMPVTP